MADSDRCLDVRRAPAADANGAECERMIRDLRELIDALDRRLPQVQRSGEASIANAAIALRTAALARITELERHLLVP